MEQMSILGPMDKLLWDMREAVELATRASMDGKNHMVAGYMDAVKRLADDVIALCGKQRSGGSGKK